MLVGIHITINLLLAPARSVVVRFRELMAKLVVRHGSCDCGLRVLAQYE